MKYIFFFLFSCLLIPAKSQSGRGILPLIPMPTAVEPRSGHFILSQNTILNTGSESLKKEGAFFNEFLKANNGFRLKAVNNYVGKDQLILRLEKNNDPDFYPICFREAYKLFIYPDSIVIRGDTLGVFNAFQTLKQLIGVQSTPTVSLPCLEIRDMPLYRWRGMHLDVCRHFFPVSFIKRYIDLLAMYKFNTFHWHLTEDQGWRIEIKKYPLLTKTGAWRSGSMIGKYDDHKFDDRRYGGFYTQKEIREVVAYAQQRHITIVPEIEMPGHSVAAIASYPYLSCSGKSIEVEKSWGVFDDVYCTKDSTFEFLQDVLTEVMALFPGRYIHIGGDECPKASWKKCAQCQARIKSEGLKDEHELQSYFIRRIEKFVNSKGRQIIGWDEILEGGLAPNAAVMSWRGIEGGIAAAKQKHNVVMSPGRPCYFDHYQSKDKAAEPLAIGGYNPLDSVYAYNPMPAQLSQEESYYILGAQANVWTEYILDEKRLEYMAVPRMCALSEALWKPKEDKSYPDFINRLKEHSKLLDKMNVNYAKHFLTPPKK